MAFIRQDVSGGVRGVCDALSVREVRTGNGPTTTVRTGELTKKQRETLVRTIDTGYYDTPRQAALNELRDDLDISESAVSQRLRKAESTIVTQVSDELAREDADGSDA